MTRVLILGGTGLLGHKAYQVLSKEFETYVTFRNFDDRLKQTRIFDEKKILDNVDVFEIEKVEEIFSNLKPDVVLNCIGIVKQNSNSQNPKLSIYVNSLLPHLLAGHCENVNAKLIHISTDCVFSGKNGNYKENDFSDAEDLYGRTKYLGEVGNNTLTLRTSIIGHELFTNFSLVDWFLSQENKSVKGFKNAIYTGFPTITFCNELVRIINSYPRLTGLYNISTEKISKYDLLNDIKEIYKCKIEIEPFKNFYCDRSLDSNKYRSKTNFKSKSWKEMINEMYEDKQNNNYYK